MNKELLSQIDEKIATVREDLARTTIELVNIKSVLSEPLPGAPFGIGPRRVLDAVLQLGETLGLACTDYGVGVISLALKEGQPDLGIWLHGDVVPEGDGWNYEPYNAVEYKGCIIGRGATDNKGQLAAIYHLFKIFKELGIELNYNAALYVGSNEEFGMTDLIGIPENPDAKGFLNICTPPRLSLVPDDGFPLGYGGKGAANLTLTCQTPLNGLTLTAGLEDSPGRATAVFTDTKDILTAETPPRHGAHPDPNGNMITKLAATLLANDRITAEDRPKLEFFKTVSSDIHGTLFGIDITNDTMGPLTVFSRRITCENGYPTLSLNIRYPMGITYEEIVENVSRVAAQYGFSTSGKRGVDPYMQDHESEVPQALCRVANEVTGNNSAPHTLSGGTYAHRLPNAFTYGMNGNLPPEDFPKGHGGAHGVDEAVSLDRLQRAMRIYARALLQLNELTW